MRPIIDSLLVGLVAMAAAHMAGAQPVVPPAAPASAALPQSAASRQLPARNPAVVAAENAKAPGLQRPEERVIPQLTLALKNRKGTPAAAASAPAGLPGAVNDSAARCLAAEDKAACQREAPEPGSLKTGR